MVLEYRMHDLYNIYEEAECIIIHNDGRQYQYAAGSPQYEKLIAAWGKLIEGAHDMPAFGVSINKLTLEEMKGGLWIEFVFKEVNEVNGMPFERLLVAVKDDYYGFNLIRYTKERGYDGRCFYFDLVNKNMADLAAEMRNLIS